NSNFEIVRASRDGTLSTIILIMNTPYDFEVAVVFLNAARSSGHDKGCNQGREGGRVGLGGAHGCSKPHRTKATREPVAMVWVLDEPACGACTP
ncbi:MAG: hypothetical protein AAFX99_12535, partial [Myxococcota bacterium]